MCGIVGYIGKRVAIRVLVNGLYNLEYRGYDSAGVAVVSNSKIHYVKCPGKVEFLARSVVGKLPDSDLGIAHTRSGTHGGPSVQNAHPQFDCTQSIAVVHNGVIENSGMLRESLVELGHSFKSETDSEVICHLIEERSKHNNTIEAAVLAALSELDGSYALAIVHSGSPDLLIAARKGSPLMIGVGEGQFVVASDEAVLVSHAGRVVHLLDGQAAFITREGVSIRTLENAEVHFDMEDVNRSAEEIGRGGYNHFMEKEIFEQPAVLTDVLRGRITEEDNSENAGGLLRVAPRLQSARRIVLVGSGTSWHSALYGKCVLERYLKIPVDVERSYDFTDRNPVVGKEDAVIAISHGGETPETLAAIRIARSKGAATLAINSAGGTLLSRECDAGIFINAGRGSGNASIQTFTSQAATFVLLTLSLTRGCELEFKEWLEITKQLCRLPDLVSETLRLEPYIREIADEFAGSANLTYLGRGFNYPVALEGAMELKEISGIQAEGYPAAETRNAATAPVRSGMPVLFIAPHDSTYEKVLRNMLEVKVRGARLISIVDEEDERIRELSEYTIRIPKTLDVLTPVLSIVPLQLLAYHIALLSGRDVDRAADPAGMVAVE